jgi:ABC-type antimicrobial peptide transport system permease subunit
VNRTRKSGWTFVPLFCVLILCSHLARAEVDTQQFEADLHAICGCGSRVIGAPGYYAAGHYLEDQIAELPKVELKKHKYSVMVPVTDSATLSCNMDGQGGRQEKVYPFWPAQIRTNSTPAEGITGNLVYAGDCQYAQLKPGSLRGQIAVIEAAAGGRWSEVFYCGSRAAIVLGSTQTSWVDLQDHDLRIPVNFPRFYVPPGALADDLRAGKIASGTLKASVHWERKPAVNYYVLVSGGKAAKKTASTKPGSAEKSAGGKSSGALMFSVPLDSTSLVPDLSPGASQAVQTASGLALVRELSKQPWKRPVVVFFSGADGIQFLGTRNMLMALGSSPANWHAEMASLDEQIKAATDELARAREIQKSPESFSASDDQGLIARITEILNGDLMETQDQLFRLRSAEGAEGSASVAADAAKLEARQDQLSELASILRDSPGTLKSTDLGQLASGYLDRVVARLGGDADDEGLIRQLTLRRKELQARVDLHNWLAKSLGTSGDSDAKGSARLIELLVALDLSDKGYRVGPMSFGYFERAANGALDQLGPYLEWISKQAEGFASHGAESTWWGKVNKIVDIDTLHSVRSAGSYLAAPLPIGSELAQGWGTPGLSMVTLDDMRLVRDTPTDTLDRIDLKAIEKQLAGVSDLFQHAWNDPTFKGQGHGKDLNGGFEGQVVSASPGNPVPDVPRSGFLATYSYMLNGGVDRKIPPLGPMPWVLGIRRTEVRACDDLGNYQFEGLPRVPSDVLVGPFNALNDLQVFAVNVYRLDRQSGAIVSATDYGKQSDDIKWAADIKQDVPQLRSLPFDCEEFSLAGMYDPRFLQTLGEATILDARRGAGPQHFAQWIDNKMMAGFVEPGTRCDLLVRYGAVGNRLILVNVPADTDKSAISATKSEGIGYTPTQLNRLGPLAQATATDFYRLDDLRLENYRRAGLSSSLIDSLHKAAGQELAAAQKAVEQDDGAGLMRNAAGAWANEARVYDATQFMARDVVRAAIFLLMICVPFSFCMERLLIGSPNVYRQLAGIGAIFLVMLAALWTFHPAFRISASPLIIVLAFAIIAMSSLVIYVVYGKFDAELKRLRSGRGSATEASLARASALTSAVLLGIANMRRRKFRTFLTSLTIVLITFAVLWFTSTSRYLGTTSVATGAPTPYPGILLRQRGFRPMPAMTAEQVRAAIADPTLKLADANVVQRWWAVSADPTDQYDLVVGNKGKSSHEYGVTAVLGLSPGEGNVSNAAAAIGPDKFARLEHGDTNIIYLTQAMAAKMSVAEGAWLRLAGIDLQVAGVFAADGFDQNVTAMSGESIAPLKYAAGELDPGGQAMDDTSQQSLELSGNAGAAEANGAYEHLSANEFVIVPAGVCKRLRNSSLRGIAVRLADEQQVKAVSDDLARRFALAIYVGYNDGVQLVSAGNLASTSGGSQVAIPLIIAALIIFNTMMGSIAERKREIHVYTSLGLAPTHVGALFVAEAMTYGLVGTVFGYILGQGMGTLLLRLGWLGNVTLNYSGSSAIMTMGLILAVVFLSALIPARVASKIAAPSIDRTWSVPAPVNDQILAVLPFTINRPAAEGALSYLAEYFEQHREGSIGKFAADRVVPVIPEHGGELSRALKTTVWLTPYDLGVRQEVLLLIHPGADANIYEVQVRLHRQSGDDASWYRMNKTFLTELRKQFLQWRSLTPARMMHYVEQSKQLFDANLTTDTVIAV